MGIIMRVDFSIGHSGQAGLWRRGLMSVKDVVAFVKLWFELAEISLFPPWLEVKAGAPYYSKLRCSTCYRNLSMDHEGNSSKFIVVPWCHVTTL